MSHSHSKCQVLSLKRFGFWQNSFSVDEKVETNLMFIRRKTEIKKFITKVRIKVGG